MADKMADNPTFSCFLSFVVDGTMVVIELFHFPTDRTGARLEGVAAEKYCFPIGSHT